MRIIVDADACPVKDIIFKEVKPYHIPVILVSSLSHYSTKEFPEYVSTVYVDPGADAADFKIVQLCQSGDIIVTQDYGLASLLLGKPCRILHHRGFEYTKSNIDTLLQTRYLSAMERQHGNRTKGPAALTESDKAKFRQLLNGVLAEQV